MKRTLLLVLFSSFFSLATIWGQSIPNNVILAFNKGDIKLLDKTISNSVTYILSTPKKVLKKDEFKKELALFFKNQPPKKFKLIHKGVKKNNGFIIGTLLTKQNEKYRVNILLKKKENKLLIYQLRITKLNE